MSAFYLEQLQRAHPIDAADRADACHVETDVSDSPCAGHPLPWLSARCIRCGQPTSSHQPALRQPAAWSGPRIDPGETNPDRATPSHTRPSPGPGTNPHPKQPTDMQPDENDETMNDETMTGHEPDNAPPEGNPGVLLCGHVPARAGCGGCDPGAIEFVQDDGGPWRRADHDRADHDTAGDL